MGKELEPKDDFIMLPKLDFTFKLLFGDANNVDILRAFLSAVLSMPREELAELQVINTELYKWYKEDKKGILDVRATTRDKKQIDIEIQITPTAYMPERTLYYWSKMYSTQIKAGETYDLLKKCITINIVDFECIDVKKLHTVYHLLEDETKHKLTDILEVHFIELPKLRDEEIEKDESDPIIEWVEFLNAKSREVMRMLGERNKDIEKAVQILEVLSQDEQARLAYEAREAQIKDELTRIKIAVEKESIETEKRVKVETAKEMIADGEPMEKIMKYTKLVPDQIEEIRKSLQH